MVLQSWFLVFVQCYVLGYSSVFMPLLVIKSASLPPSPGHFAFFASSNNRMLREGTPRRS